MSPRTGFLLHPASPLHDTGWGHPEHQGRLRALASTVGKDLLTLHGRVEQLEGREATEEELRLVHGPEHVERVAEACRRAAELGRIVAIDADTKVSAASWEAATGSTGTAMEAARAIVDGEIRNAFVAARPPGHHATPSRAMGFCLFNTIAVVARWLQREGHAERVLIVDWDVHHGNGTQDAFYDDPSVFFLSLHQWPWYPGTGAAEERGIGAGEGATLNVPMSAATPAAEYRERFERALARAASWTAPDFILVSSGFDAMAGDPLGGLLLEPDDLYAMTRRVVELAEEACDGRVLAVLEGGYDPPRLGQGAVAVIRGLAGLEAPQG
ncbi:MAG TPA: histone deacetylase [Longimicrobiales bacterium]|nr:histone deacetylase [Longimicrobiales bacterium]